MHLIAYRPSAAPADSDTMMGVVLGDSIAPLTTLRDFYRDVAGWTAKARAQQQGSVPVSSVKLAVPVQDNVKVICVAINYVEHGREGNLPVPSFPNMFARWASDLVPTGTPVPVPVTEPDGLDWEVELAAIVGEKMASVDAKRGEAGILGYTVFNDISGRASQLQCMTLSTGQWAIGKNLDNSGAIGSIVATPDSVDLGNTRLITRVNGEVMQNGTTADMVFSIGQVVEFITKSITLNPGDVIATGTPAGVGFGRNPRVYMPAGSVVEVTIEGICSVTNPIVART